MIYCVNPGMTSSTPSSVLMPPLQRLAFVLAALPLLGLGGRTYLIAIEDRVSKKNVNKPRIASPLKSGNKALNYIIPTAAPYGQAASATSSSG